MQSCQPSLCPRAWLSSICACAHSAGEQREINHLSSYSQPSVWHLCSCRDQPRSHGRNMGGIQVNCRGKGKDPGAEAELDTPAGLPGHRPYPALSAGVLSPPNTSWGRTLQGISGDIRPQKRASTSWCNFTLLCKMNQLKNRSLILNMDKSSILIPSPCE